jgi:two-component system, NtrC family, response regulator GlrR
MAEHFLGQFAARPGGPRTYLSDEARELLSTSALPGNVRQLRNITEQCVVLSPSDTISPDLMRMALKRNVSGMATLEEAMKAYERRCLLAVLCITQGNVSNAARIAGRNRTEFYKLLSRHELQPVDFRSAEE